MEGLDQFLKENNFTPDPEHNLRWTATGSYRWEYIIYFEGYAYVLYQKYRGLEVPLSHFQETEKLKIFYEILNEEIPKKEFHIESE